MGTGVCPSANCGIVTPLDFPAISVPPKCSRLLFKVSLSGRVFGYWGLKLCLDSGCVSEGNNCDQWSVFGPMVCIQTALAALPVIGQGMCIFENF